MKLSRHAFLIETSLNTVASWLEDLDELLSSASSTVIFWAVECMLLVRDIVFDKDAATIPICFSGESIILCFD